VAGNGDCTSCGCCLLLLDAAWPDGAAYAAAMAAPSIRGFTHISLSVRDLESSLAFYRDVLGLPTLAEPYDGEVFEGREAMLLAGRSALCLQEHRANTGARFDPRQTGLDHISLAVPSADELHAFAAHLDGAGVEHSGVKPLPGFGDFIELRDPDGILVELHATPAS
jgi:catechol 2,3-dioxygenase-like lactoylglutathione lyase family enzyme